MIDSRQTVGISAQSASPVTAVVTSDGLNDGPNEPFARRRSERIIATAAGALATIWKTPLRLAHNRFLWRCVLKRAALLTTATASSLLVLGSTALVSAAPTITSRDVGLVFPPKANMNTGASGIHQHVEGLAAPTCPAGAISPKDEASALLQYYKDVGVTVSVGAISLAGIVTGLTVALPIVATATGVAAACVMLPDSLTSAFFNQVSELKLTNAASYLNRLHDAASAVAKATGGAQALGFYLCVVQKNTKAGTTGWTCTAANPYGTPCATS